MKKVSGNLVDIHKREIFPAEIIIEGDRISSIIRVDAEFSNFIIPGFIDAHVHIESSLLIPTEFAKVAMRHGTVATVSDPHEIANVLGVKGVEFMIENGKKAALKFNWCAPSCVPATDFESSGSIIGVSEIDTLLKKPEIVALAEMMNYPGVIYDNPEVYQKLNKAFQYKKPVDGHVPGLMGDALKKYANAGISTDHECTSITEALEKLNLGMKILIRNGSSAKNFEALHSLINSHPDKVMLCCDDIHAHDLIDGHINKIASIGVQKGLDLFNILRATSINPIEHYKLDCGLLRIEEKADFCIVTDLLKFEVIETWINGDCVYSNANENVLFSEKSMPINNFNCKVVSPQELIVKNEFKDFTVINAINGELITRKSKYINNSKEIFLKSNPADDILKLVVLNRYKVAKPAIAYIKGFGLQEGAIASSIAHDSHNIIAVGVSDEDISRAINTIIGCKGGMCIYSKSVSKLLELPYAGLMSGENAKNVSDKYTELKELAHNFGSQLNSPFMTLSFMALLVIPEIKLSDLGLFDGNKFEFTPLFI